MEYVEKLPGDSADKHAQNDLMYEAIQETMGYLHELIGEVRERTLATIDVRNTAVMRNIKDAERLMDSTMNGMEAKVVDMEQLLVHTARKAGMLPGGCIIATLCCEGCDVDFQGNINVAPSGLRGTIHCIDCYEEEEEEVDEEELEEEDEEGVSTDDKSGFDASSWG